MSAFGWLSAIATGLLIGALVSVNLAPQFKLYVAKRRSENAARLFQRGYDWTAGALLMGDSPEGVKLHRWDAGKEYHAGRRAALQDWADHEAVQHDFQERVDLWLEACMGADAKDARDERNHRFLEEALELVQACGCTEGDALQLVAYVYGRPAGERAQEVGGAFTTLAALCTAQGLDMRKCGEKELARSWERIELIRAKRAAKPAIGPLPRVCRLTVDSDCVVNGAASRGPMETVIEPGFDYHVELPK